LNWSKGPEAVKSLKLSWTEPSIEESNEDSDEVSLNEEFGEEWLSEEFEEVSFKDSDEELLFE
jgi:hypothetical protein